MLYRRYGMVYSGSSFEFLESWMRIQSILFKHIWQLYKKATEIQSKRRICQLSAIFYFILQAFSTVPTVQNSQACDNEGYVCPVIRIRYFSYYKHILVDACWGVPAVLCVPAPQHAARAGGCPACGSHQTGRRIAKLYVCVGLVVSCSCH